MVLREKEFSRDQEDYIEVICTLVERYEAEHVKWPEVSPVDMLRHLLDEHQMSGADLSRLLGGSRQLGPMILRGERSITASHAGNLPPTSVFSLGCSFRCEISAGCDHDDAYQDCQEEKFHGTSGSIGCDLGKMEKGMSGYY